MIDLLNLKENSYRLTDEIPLFKISENSQGTRWNGSHPKFLNNMYKIVDLEVTSFNGDKEKGTVARTIPYVDLQDGKTVALLAKCRTFIGGIRSVLTKVKYGWEEDRQYSNAKVHKSNAIFNASCVETTTAPKESLYPVRFENLFVIEPTRSKKLVKGKIKRVVTATDLFASRTTPPPVPRSSYSERIKRTPSVETFPNADVKDDGLMPQVVSVKVINSTDAMQLTIILADGSERKVGFMPVSALLVDDRDRVIASHFKVACGNYGYGFLEEDPYSEIYGIEIFNKAPAANQYDGQERWHVPYKDLIRRSWEKAVGPMSSTTFSQSGSAKENPYIFKQVSDANPSNRYTMYDLQIRPPTFLPLFMTAAVCHEGGATAFARALAQGLIESLQLSIVDTTVTFTQPVPSWVTDAKAYRESIVTLLLLGGFIIKQATDERGTTTTVDFSDATPLRGSPSDSFWRILAEVSGLKSVSDLITHYGVTNGVANIPSSVTIAAAVKDPIAFGASMGITVVKVGEGYMIGSRYYTNTTELVSALSEAAVHVISIDKTNVENIATALGFPDTDEIESEPKRYARPFNWLLLLPHVMTAAAMVATKATQREHLGV
jgi:hypothetical protein